MSGTQPPGTASGQDYQDAVVLAVRLGEVLRAVPLEALFEEYGIDPESYGEVMGAIAGYFVNEKDMVSMALESWTPYRDELPSPGA